MRRTDRAREGVGYRDARQLKLDSRPLALSYPTSSIHTDNIFTLWFQTFQPIWLKDLNSKQVWIPRQGRIQGRASGARLLDPLCRFLCVCVRLLSCPPSKARNLIIQNSYENVWLIKKIARSLIWRPDVEVERSRVSLNVSWGTAPLSVVVVVSSILFLKGVRDRNPTLYAFFP